MQKGSTVKTISAAEPSTNESGEQERVGGCGAGFESITLSSGGGGSSSSSSPARTEDNHNERSHDYANIIRLPPVERDRLTKVGWAAPATASLGGSLLSSTARSESEQNKRDEDQTTGEFVVHHVTFDERPIDASNNNDDDDDDTIQQTQEVDLATEASGYCYTTGENTRCNCSGRRRATLTGLIELFEQKVRIEEPKSDGSEADGAGTGNLRVTKARNRLPLAPEFEPATTKISNQTVNKVNNHNIGEMRNIITPVKYHSSETEDDGDDDENDEDDDDDVEHELDDERARLAGNNNNSGGSSGLARAALHRVATKGVPVLPRPESRKLTDTNWQPATDGRRYEQLAGGQHLSAHLSKAGSCSQRPSRRKVTSSSLAATRGPPIVKHQASSSRRLLDQLARLRRLREPNYRIKRPEKVERVESLIDQLERATVEWEEDDQLLDRAERRDWPYHYHERFSEPSARYPLEAAEVDSRVITDFDFGCRNDVNSLEEHAIARSHSVLSMKQPSLQAGHQPASQVRYVAAGPWSSSLGRPVQRSRPRAFADRYFDDLAVRRLSSKSPTTSHSRLSLAPDPAMSEVQIDFSSGHQMSYLLCSNAYTPTIEGADWDAVDRRVRNDDLHYRSVKIKPDPHEPPFGIPRQPSLAGTHSSASHYLRYSTNTAARASPASPVCTCSCACPQHQQVLWKHRQPAQQNNEQAPQKRVSILEQASAPGDRNRYSGCASADSGIVREGGTPSSMGERQSTLTRLTPSSPQDLMRSPRTTPGQHDSPLGQQQADFEYLDTEEVDLDLELKRTGQDETEDPRIRWSPCESPALERHKAEIRATPSRSRPKIKIENPRAKSPLLRASRKPIASSTPNERPSPTEKGVVQVQCYRDTIPKPSALRKPVSELECHHNFQDDSEEEPEEEERPARRIVTTNLDSSDSSPNESSFERYNYRGANSATRVGSNEARDDPKRNDSGKPLFSIGEYKPLNKPNLKIL